MFAVIILRLALTRAIDHAPLSFIVARLTEDERSPVKDGGASSAGLK